MCEAALVNQLIEQGGKTALFGQSPPLKQALI
jgi:hypothetical protein